MVEPTMMTPQKLRCDRYLLRVFRFLAVVMVFVWVLSCCIVQPWGVSREPQEAKRQPAAATSNPFDGDNSLGGSLIRIAQSTKTNEKGVQPGPIVHWVREILDERVQRERDGSSIPRRVQRIKSRWHMIVHDDVTPTQDHSTENNDNKRHVTKAENPFQKFAWSINFWPLQTRQIRRSGQRPNFADSFYGRRLSNNSIAGSQTASNSTTTSSGNQAVGGGGGFSVSQPNKQGAPKYSNCNDDVYGASGPCSGYTSSAPTSGFHAYSLDTISPATSPTALSSPSAPHTVAPTMVFHAFGVTISPALPTSPSSPSAPSTVAPTRVFQAFGLTTSPISVTTPSASLTPIPPSSVSPAPLAPFNKTALSTTAPSSRPLHFVLARPTKTLAPAATIQPSSFVPSINSSVAVASYKGNVTLIPFLTTTPSSSPQLTSAAPSLSGTQPPVTTLPLPSSETFNNSFQLDVSVLEFSVKPHNVSQRVALVDRI